MDVLAGLTVLAMFTVVPPALYRFYDFLDRLWPT